MELGYRGAAYDLSQFDDKVSTAEPSDVIESAIDVTLSVILLGRSEISRSISAALTIEALTSTNDYNVAAEGGAKQVEDTITVWISTGRDQMDVLRRLINESFTSQSNIAAFR